MNTQRTNQIGIDRIIRLNWLEKTAYLVLAGISHSTIRETLKQEIANSFNTSENTVRGALHKTLTNLIKIWVRPPRNLQAFHEDGLLFLKKLPSNQHLAVHWGMTMAVYPFWANVASHVGRILKLQNSFQLRSIQRRLREQYGERETVSRSTQRVIRSFWDWGVLQDGDKRGLYKQGKTIMLNEPALIAWLVEAYIYAFPDNSPALNLILNAPCFFPIKFNTLSSNILDGNSNRLEVIRHGLDQEMIVLNTTRK